MNIARLILKRSWLGTLALAVVLTGLSLSPSTAAAEEIQITGPLAGAPACRSCRIYREGRISLTPSVGFTLQDEFNQTILFGATATYHLFDWLGIGAYFGYGGVQLTTGLTDQVTAQGITTQRNRLSLPSRAFFSEQIGQITWIAAPQITFIPLRGKLALFQKLFIDTDFHISLGAGLIGIAERPNVDSESYANNCAGVVPPVVDGMPPLSDTCVAQTQNVARTSRVAVTGTFAAGLSMYFNDFLALTIEWRGMPFAWNTSGTDQSGAEAGDFPDDRIDEADQIFHFNHMVTVGLSIYLPTEARVSE